MHQITEFITSRLDLEKLPEQILMLGFVYRMVEASQDDENAKYPEEMIRAFALLKASRAQFQAHPERIEFEGSPNVRWIYPTFDLEQRIF